jgi:aminodeoxyfutalosine synthase
VSRARQEDRAISARRTRAATYPEGVSDTRKQEIEEKVYAGERLTRADGEWLYEVDDLAWLGGLAHHVRTKKNGEVTLFNVNRHLNLTNVCSASCAYCSFQRKPGEADAYTMRLEEAVRLAKEMEPAGITELHVVNGLHPTLPWRYYPRSISALKEALPGVTIKAFTATEIQWFEKISGLSASDILDELMAAGLESLTGGGAEIFDPEIRMQIVDHACHWEDWSRIHRLAHEKGIKTPCTMLYGHIEEPRHRVDHVLRLRELQDETGGFVVFIPLRYQHDFHDAKDGIVRNRLMDHTTMATGAEALRTFAVSRLLFDNVPHVKNFWVMHGLTTAQLSLSFGADDLDGSVVEYKITHDADGFGTPTTMTRDDLLGLIRDAGFTPAERNTRYDIVQRFDGPDPTRRDTPQSVWA